MALNNVPYKSLVATVVYRFQLPVCDATGKLAGVELTLVNSKVNSG